MRRNKILNMFCIVLMILLSLVGCGSEESNDIQDEQLELNEEEFALVMNPETDYIVAALYQVDSVIGVEKDPKPEEGYVAKIFFSSDLVDQSEFKENESVSEKGTKSGGSIDVFRTVDEAVERNEYLKGFDGNFLLDSGSHVVVGTLVIRTSSLLEEEVQEELTQKIIDVLVSGNVTEEDIKNVNKNEVVDRNNTSTNNDKIVMPFSHDEVYYKHYTEIEELFRALGFRNIEYNITAMNQNVEEEFDGSVLAVHIDGEWKFEEKAEYTKDTSIVISYVEDRGIEVPMSSIKCEELHYKEAVKAFEDAGFTNVTAIPTEVEYTTSVEDGSIIIVSVNDNPIFGEDAKFNSDDVVLIHYRKMKEKVEEVTEKKEQNTTTKTEKMVWIPTNGGTKYHSKKGCSNMEDPIQVPISEAQDMGYDACKRCH